MNDIHISLNSLFQSLHKCGQVMPNMLTSAKHALTQFLFIIFMCMYVLLPQMFPGYYCTASSVRPFYSPNLIFLFSFPLSVSWSCPFPRTQTLSWSTTWMCQLSRIVGSHVGPSCAPSIQTRKNGPNGRRRNSLASWNPCVSVQSHSINWMHNLSLLMHVLSDHCKQSQEIQV